MQPPPRSSMWGMAYLLASTPPSTFTWMISWNTAGSNSRKSTSRLRRPAAVLTALLNRMSSWPNSAIVRAIISFRASSSPTSTCRAKARPPAARTSSATTSADEASMSAMATMAPSAANFRAEARPMPEPAPVMTADLPFRRSMRRLLSRGSWTVGRARSRRSLRRASPPGSARGYPRGDRSPHGAAGRRSWSTARRRNRAATAESRHCSDRRSGRSVPTSRS